MLEAKNLSLTIQNNWLVNGFSYRFEPGKWHVLCGPNGAGKSSLLRLLALQQDPSSGTVFYEGTVASRKHTARYATCRAVLSQQVDIPFPVTVEELIMMGRYPHFAIRPSLRDKAICAEITEKLGIGALQRRNYLTLSGGEKQRVQFARVLAQLWDAPPASGRYLLLDEPTSALDIRHQFDFLQQVREFIDERTVVIAVLHDLNLALNFADEVLLMHQGRLYRSGVPGEVLLPANIEAVYQWKSRRIDVADARLLWKCG